MSITFNSLSAADPGKNTSNAYERFFTSSVVANAPVLDLEVNEKQVLVDYCTLIKKELIDYGDFPIFKNSNTSNLRIKLDKGWPEHYSYYPYRFFIDSVVGDLDAKSSLRFALYNLERSLKLEDDQSDTEEGNPSAAALESAREFLTWTRQYIKNELSFFEKQMNNFTDTKADLTNDDWNYYKSTKALLEKTNLRLFRLINCIVGSINWPYDRWGFKELKEEMSKQK